MRHPLRGPFYIKKKKIKNCNSNMIPRGQRREEALQHFGFSSVSKIHEAIHRACLNPLQFLGIHNERFLYYSSFFIGSHFETSLGTGILQIGLLN